MIVLAIRYRKKTLDIFFCRFKLTPPTCHFPFSARPLWARYGLIYPVALLLVSADVLRYCVGCLQIREMYYLRMYFIISLVSVMPVPFRINCNRKWILLCIRIIGNTIGRYDGHTCHKVADHSLEPPNSQHCPRYERQYCLPFSRQSTSTMLVSEYVQWKLVA
jgi:hypothetical protein